MSVKTNMRKGVVERLKTLDLSAYEDSHGRLSAICKAVIDPAFGWSLGACEVLRERLIYLIGGSDDDADASEDGGPTVPCAAGRADDRKCHQQPTKDIADINLDVMSLSVRTFELDTPKDTATKVLEEASEAREAAQQVRECNRRNKKWCGLCDWKYHQNVPQECKHWNLADELADVVQAACNLAARYGIDMEAAMERCEQRQRERGRL